MAISKPSDSAGRGIFARKNILVLFVIAALAACTPASDQISASVPDLSVDVLIRGLDTPWAIAFASDGRIFVTERPGRIRIVKNGQLESEPWMALEVSDVGEAGLLGLALDPRFAETRFVYVAYTYRGQNRRLANRLARLREDPKSGKGTLDKVLIDNVAAANNHDGGRVKFGPDGKLYWTMGDAQETSHAQRLSSLNGKILRLNPDGSIPADNPFPNSYVYSYGHRNPQGLAWQSGTGRLYATEHGPSGFQGCCRDEVNFIEPGKNYGWPDIRGDESKEGMAPSVIHAGTSETWAPGGATFVSRGPWAGSFVFTGLRGQTLYRVRFDPKEPRKVLGFERHFYRQFGRLRDVVEAPDGNLYLLTSNRDGRGSPAQDDDRVIRLQFK
jgi:glucose/arabinose dehydrogenase